MKLHPTSELNNRRLISARGWVPGAVCAGLTHPPPNFMNEKTLQKRNTCDLQAVLQTPPGRRLMWRILQAAQIEAHGFVAGDSHATSFHCGQRSIGLFMLAEMERAMPGIYTRIKQEQLAELETLQQAINRQQEDL